MQTKSPRAIRISETDEVKKVLRKAKAVYPTLSDAEIFKLGLALLTNGNRVKTAFEKESDDIARMAAYSVGYDYLSDPEEDIYTLDMGKKVNFS